MEKNLIYGTTGCFVGTLIGLFAVKYNPQPIILVLLPMWGLVMGVSIARVIPEKTVSKKRKK